MSLTGAPWFTIPVAIASTVLVVTALANFRNRRALLYRAQFIAPRDAESFISAVAQLADTDGRDISPLAVNAAAAVIDLNTAHRRIAVSEERLLRVSSSLLSLFDRYVVACHCSTLPDAVKVDMWNCLGAVVEAHIKAYVRANVMSDNIADASTVLAVSETLFGRRYHVTRFLTVPLSSSGLLLRTPPWHLLAAAVRKNRDERSALRSISLFTGLLHRTCTGPKKLLLALLAIVNITDISRLIQTMSPATVPSALSYTVEVLNEAATTDAVHPCTLRRFVWQVVSSSPGRMLGSATLCVLVSHLLSSAKEAASDAMLHRLHMNIKTDTLLALTRFDYIGDPHWPLPGRVYSALSVVTNFSFADIDRVLNLVVERVQLWHTVWRFPVACTVGWLTRQVLDWLQWGWTRACLMTSFVASYGKNTSGCCRSSGERVGRPEYHRSGFTYRTHYGLQVLLLAAATSPQRSSSSTAVVLWLAQHTRWPLVPRTCLEATEQILGVVSGADDSAKLLHAQYDAVRELCTMCVEEETHPSGSFSTMLGSRRACGDFELELPSWQSALTMLTAGADSDVLEDVVDKALSSSNSVPIMAAVAAAGVQSRAPSGTTPPRSGDVVAGVYEVTRVVESGGLFVMPPARPWALVSSFQFDVQTAQQHYHDHETYARSMEVLVHVHQTHKPTLDGKRWEQYDTPPSLLLPNNSTSAAWRVTFDHVSFRYPGTEHDVLHDISFDVPPGNLLGIVGYSGAGKTTLLLLLSRVYAPTQGHIRINGYPIECIPPRALRRRLGNCWQGDRDTCFLEGINIEQNVAYGNLDAASTSSVTTALSLACMDVAVAERANGLKEPLWYSEWSGGEVARIMLARAAMVPPDHAGMYIFDECTNGLDSLTEEKVFSRNLYRQRSVTRVLVSHRLASLRPADEILVLAHGRVVERGTWTQLLRGGDSSLFCTLHRAQAVS
ncbi:hypothetical protein JKF63_02358 [Porcisia hertigi]|uniref:ABC transporter domain-containing protein n=1 Tax=Porcisia hertigi TaxID=2761500 RepID=A0A836L1L6_9TRYP|nr:hypothetical protein JKF63_02358 [Porcisia hertigi]